MEFSGATANVTVDVSWTMAFHRYAPMHVFVIDARGNASSLVPLFFQFDEGISHEQSDEVALGTPYKNATVHYPLPDEQHLLPFHNLTAPVVPTGWVVWAWANMTVPGNITIHWPAGTHVGSIVSGSFASANMATMRGGVHLLTPVVQAGQNDMLAGQHGRGFLLEVYAFRAEAEQGQWSAQWENGTASGDLAGPFSPTCISCYDQHAWLVSGNGTPQLSANYVGYSQESRLYASIITLPFPIPAFRLDWDDSVPGP